MALVLFGIGFFTLFSAIFPVVRFQLEYASKFGQIVNPLSARFYNQNGSILGDYNTDYTQLSNWFISSTTLPQLANSDGSLIQYHISIPAAKVDDAVVTLGDMDLKKSLVQYPQTALPGQYGNTVIFGHSVLPQFFNPKSYLTIFSTLYRLKIGDEIYVKYDNITYKYLIEDMYEVQPTDLSVLEQRYDGRYLTLITCSPPGTWLRRLIIKASLADY
ncbi:sortase [Patescibacteria group bacterium]|nr:sortase [Patescibacteria group bacterium]